MKLFTRHLNFSLALYVLPLKLNSHMMLLYESKFFTIADQSLARTNSENEMLAQNVSKPKKLELNK